MNRCHGRVGERKACPSFAGRLACWRLQKLSRVADFSLNHGYHGLDSEERSVICEAEKLNLSRVFE